MLGANQIGQVMFVRIEYDRRIVFFYVRPGESGGRIAVAVKEIEGHIFAKTIEAVEAQAAVVRDLGYIKDESPMTTRFFRTQPEQVKLILDFEVNLWWLIVVVEQLQTWESNMIF